LTKNKITDLSSKFILPSQIKRLILSENSITKFNLIGTYSLLSYLDFKLNKIQRLDRINAENLIHLDLSSNNIDSLNSIDQFSKLEVLRVDHNQLDKVEESLTHLINLNTLTLVGNKIRCIRYLQNLTKLVWLNLNSNQIDDISWIKNLTNLYSVNLANNKLKDFDDDSNLNWYKLEMLDLSYNQLTNISFLKKFYKLNSLNLDFNLINDIQDLKLLINLNKLSLNGNRLVNIDVIKNLNQFQSMKFLYKLDIINLILLT
jgi:Leucine-rich repeat (LRR) protein